MSNSREHFRRVLLGFDLGPDMLDDAVRADEEGHAMDVGIFWAHETMCGGRVDPAASPDYFLRMATASQVQKTLRAAMKEALRIQDRFVAEPLFAKTGRGYLKSEGVATLHKIKANLRRRVSTKSK